MSPLFTRSLKNLLELTAMISSYISFLSKYTTEQITADSFGVKTALRTNTVSQASVNELHSKIHSLSLLFKVRDTSLSLCPRSRERERVQIGRGQICPQSPSLTVSFLPHLAHDFGFILVGSTLLPHPPVPNSFPSISEDVFCDIN